MRICLVSFIQFCNPYCYYCSVIWIDRWLFFNCVLVSNSLQVTSSDGTKTYVVHIEVGICSCPRGADGTLCKHIYGLQNHFQINVKNRSKLAITAQDRAEMHRLATGTHKQLSYYVFDRFESYFCTFYCFTFYVIICYVWFSFLLSIRRCSETSAS